MFNEMENALVAFLAAGEGLAAHPGAPWYVPQAKITRAAPLPAGGDASVLPAVILQLKEFKAAEHAREEIGTGRQPALETADSCLLLCDLFYCLSIFASTPDSCHAIMQKSIELLAGFPTGSETESSDYKSLDIKLLSGAAAIPIADGNGNILCKDELLYRVQCSLKIMQSSTGGGVMEQILIQKQSIDT